MKPSHGTLSSVAYLILVLVSTSMFTTGHVIASDKKKNSASKKTEENDEDAKVPPPKIGMSKAQVLARYGKPDMTMVTSKGETWTYTFGKPGGRQFIPYYDWATMFKKPQSGMIMFGSNGRVKDYSFTEGKSVGDAMMGR